MQNTKVALIVSLCLFSIPPSLASGLTGIILTQRQIKIERKSV